MASRLPRNRPGVRILTGIVRVLAAVILALAASAALADLDLHSVDFYRILPVVLTGEGIVYILMLGGGSVAGPVLLLTVVLTFALRAGIALGAAILSPQAGADLMAGAQFYYASYWPAVIAQVLMMAIMLRLLRPLIRRRRKIAVRPHSEADEADEEERRERLLVALTESTAEPPESPTALEEQQIGDLTEITVTKPDAAPTAPQDPTLPFDDEQDTADTEEEPEDEAPLPPGVIDARPGMAASEEPVASEEEPEDEAPLPPGVIDARPGMAGSEEPVASEEEPEDEAPLPPGVIDARPGMAASEEPAAPEEEPEDEAPLPPGVIDARPGMAASEEPAAPEEEPEREPEPRTEPMPGEETERLEPLAQAASFDLGSVTPPENLQEMVSVISGAAGDGCQVRVWGTSDGRTILAAVPAGTPAAGTATHADALVMTHLRMCRHLRTGDSCQQLTTAALGGWAVQTLDADGGVVLVMATRDQRAIGRLQLATERTADALRGMATAAGAVPRPRDESEVPLIPEAGLSDSIEAAAHAVGGRFVDGWRAWRGPHRRLVAAVAPPGVDAKPVAEIAQQAVIPVERFADAIALDRPRWLALSSGSAMLVLVWAEVGGESLVLSAQTVGEAAIGRTRWELAEIARTAAELSG